MKLDKLAILKNKLVTAKEFDQPWNYFFDHFGENPKFMALGESTQEPLLDVVLSRIAKELYGEKAQVSPAMLVEIKEHQFVHGSCMIEGRLVVIIFFRDVDMGLLSVLDSGGSRGKTLLMRFSAYPVDADKAAQLDPRTGTQIN